MRSTMKEVHRTRHLNDCWLMPAQQEKMWGLTCHSWKNFRWYCPAAVPSVTVPTPRPGLLGMCLSELGKFVKTWKMIKNWSCLSPYIKKTTLKYILPETPLCIWPLRTCHNNLVLLGKFDHPATWLVRYQTEWEFRFPVHDCGNGWCKIEDQGVCVHFISSKYTDK